MIRSIMLLTLLAVTPPVIYSGDKIGGLFVGADYLPNNKYNETSSGVYKLQKPGVSVGVLIPIGLPFFDYYYKVKASTHSIESRGWDWSGQLQKDEAALYDRHASFVNEILVGKDMPISEQTSIMPLLGVGYQLDALNQDGDSPVGGIVYSCLYADISGMIRYRLDKFGFGILANYQLGVLPSWEGYEATDRLSISAVLFK